MVGALSIVGSSALDLLTGPCLRVDALPTTRMNLKSGGGTVLCKKQSVKRGAMQLSSSFINAGREWRLCVNRNPRKLRSNRRVKMVNELGGQYEDTFVDVTTQLLYYYTCMAARVVLQLLYEMNPTKYRRFYELAINRLADEKRFIIRTLGKEKQDLAKRVMITRLHLYGKWIKKCNLAEICQEISDENLELMRERLMETMNRFCPSDDTNIEKVG